jgi:ubiquitin carboxyl-terminal hydrolase 2/21
LNKPYEAHPKYAYSHYPTKDYSSPSEYGFNANPYAYTHNTGARGVGIPPRKTSETGLPHLHQGPTLHHKPSFNIPSIHGTSKPTDPYMPHKNELHSSHLHNAPRTGTYLDGHYPYTKMHQEHQGLLGGHTSSYDAYHTEAKHHGAVRLMGIEGQRKPDGMLTSARKNTGTFGHAHGGHVSSIDHLSELEEDGGARTLPSLKDKYAKEGQTAHHHEGHGVRTVHQNELKALKSSTMHVTSAHALIEPRGLVGLKNIGNTCFMNSILQSLFNAPVFSDYFLKGTYTKEINQKHDKGIAKCYAELLSSIRSHSGSPSYSPESTYQLKRRIEESNPMFEGYAQHDAQEFLKALLEGIHEDVNRAVVKPAYKELKADTNVPLQITSTEWYNYMLGRDNSIVTDLFGGQLLSKTTCTHCGYESIAFDNYWDLSVSFTRGLSMLDKCDLPRMIEHFLKEEILDDLFNCERCKQKRKFKKCFSFWRLPKILPIHLKRFHFAKYKKEKITHNVKFPVKNLDLSEFVKESKDISVKDAKYSLFAMVNHSGNLNAGHYTAECMNLNNKKWYNFNDSMVKESHIISDKDTEIEGDAPYILFYIKNSCIEG